MRIQIRGALVAVAAAMALTSCGPFHRGSQPESVVVFRNQSPDQADVYAIGAGGDPIRIGTVYAGRTETLRVPSSITGASSRVNVVARIFPTGRVVVTGPFTLMPGDSMDVTLTGDQKILSVLPSRSQ
jgi:hypothetical protein